MKRVWSFAIIVLLLPAACMGRSKTPGRVPEIHESPGAMYETVFKIPAGEEGVSYQGLDMPEIQVTGPNALALAADGSFFIADLIDNRLLHYSPDGKPVTKINLNALGITNVSDLVSTERELYLLEISFHAAPERYRVSRMSFEGTLISQYDIPKGYHFEDGLYGLATPGSQGEIILELLAPKQRYYQLADPKDGHSGDVAGIPANGQIYQVEPSGPENTPAIRAGPLKVESRMTMGGLLRVLAVNPEGSFYVIREDMVADLPVIQGDITIHLLSSEGEQLGAARYPLSEWLYFVQRPAAIGRDGNVYGLVPRRESVDIVRLTFYERLDPLIPGAVEPRVSRMKGPSADCSLIRHLSADSKEAREVVQEFLRNFREDFPTEYMELEPLWGVDRLGEYAVIQGRVTEEEDDLIVVHRTDRGFVMAARYVVNVPGPRHANIAQSLIEQVPKAPPELFLCLDLRRYRGG